MDLINKEDMAVWTPFAANTESKVFTSALQQETDKIGSRISDELLTAIQALERGVATTTDTYQFWFNYVRPYVVNKVFLDLCQTHGYNMQSQGLVAFRDGQNTSAAVQGSERSQMIRKYESEANLYLTKMLWEFNDKEGTFDGTTYEVNLEKYSGTRSNPALNVIGGVNNKIRFGGIKFRL